MRICIYINICAIGCILVLWPTHTSYTVNRGGILIKAQARLNTCRSYAIVPEEMGCRTLQSKTLMAAVYLFKNRNCVFICGPSANRHRSGRLNQTSHKPLNALA